MKALIRLPCVQFRHVDQYLFGQQSRKGTGLLLLRLPGVDAEFRNAGNQSKCNHPEGHTASIGRADDGSFRTAPLKVYPPALCGVLARGFVSHATMLHSKKQYDTAPEQLSAALADFYQTESQCETGVQKDYYE